MKIYVSSQNFHFHIIISYDKQIWEADIVTHYWAYARSPTIYNTFSLSIQFF